MCYNYTYRKVQVAPNLTKSVISCILGIWTWPTGGCCSPAHGTSSSSHCLLLLIIHETNRSLVAQSAEVRTRWKPAAGRVSSVNALIDVGRKLPCKPTCVPHRVRENSAHSCVYAALYNRDWAQLPGKTGTGDSLLKHVWLFFLKSIAAASSKVSSICPTTEKT